MIRELMNHLGYGFFSEAALVIFLAVFVAVTIRTLRMGPAESLSHARIVLAEKPRGAGHEP